MSSINILQREAPYLDSSRNKLLLIAFLAIFTLIFLTVYNPFNMNQWGGSSLGYVSIGMAVLLSSQFLLRPIFKTQRFKWYQLILWGAAEILLISYLIYLIYGPVLITFGEKVDEYLLTLKYVCLIILCPYLFFIWYLALKHKFSSFKKLDPNSLSPSSTGNALLTITGENNKVILAINYNRLLYIKSSGNYLDIYYLKGETASKELVRVSLKELESKITDSSIVRIHRSYMVNKHKISSFKKTRKGYQLLVQHAPEKILPVSLGYKDKFEEALEIKVSH